MCRLVDCFENSLVDGRIYRYTRQQNGTVLFPLPPTGMGGGGVGLHALRQQQHRHGAEA